MDLVGAEDLTVAGPECPDAVDRITAERGRRYGHPRDHFATTQRLWEGRRKAVMPRHEAVTLEENCLRHVVYLICDKLTRAAQDPMHRDNWDDIEGYVRCLKRCLYEEVPTSFEERRR